MKSDHVSGTPNQITPTDEIMPDLNHSDIYTGFVHFFVNRIQDFFQTFSRPFFLFSRLKITVKFFMAREEIIVLIMKTTNKKRKKTVSAV